MSTSFFAFLPQVLPEVDGCPDIVAVEAIRTAAIELCERASVWKVYYDPIDVIAMVPEYELDIPTGAYSKAINKITFNGNVLKPRLTEQLDRDVPNWQTMTGSPFGFFMSADDTIRLVYEPDTTYPQSMYVTGTLAPTRNSSVIDDEVYQRYYPLIAIGAKALLFLQQQKKWSNANLGAALADTFAAGVNAAYAHKLTGQANVQLQARPKYAFVRSTWL